MQPVTYTTRLRTLIYIFICCTFIHLKIKFLINYSGNSLFFSNMFIILLLLFFRALYSRVKNQRIKVISLYHNFQEFIQLFYEGPSIFDFLNQNIYNFASNYLIKLFVVFFWQQIIYTLFEFYITVVSDITCASITSITLFFRGGGQMGMGDFFFWGGGGITTKHLVKVLLSLMI